MRRARSFVLLAWGLFACSGSGGAKTATNTPPQVTFANLAGPVMALVGGTVRIDYSDDDPDSDAVTTFYADVDGDLLTTGDQFMIAAGLPEMGGIAQSVAWDTAGAPVATYRILAVIEDEDSSATVEAAGPVTVNAVASFAPAHGTALRGTLYNARIVFELPLSNATITEATLPISVGGAQVPGTYSVENGREVVFEPDACVFPAPGLVLIGVMTTVGVTDASPVLSASASLTTAVSPVWVIGSQQTRVSRVDAIAGIEEDAFDLGPGDDPWFLVCSTGGMLYMSNAGTTPEPDADGDVIVFDTASGLIEGRVALAETDPDLLTIPAGLVLSADERTLYVAVFEGADYQDAGASAYLAVVDVATAAETGRIALGANGRLRNLTLSRDGSRAYVAGYDAAVIHVVDLVAEAELDTDGDPGNGITPVATGPRPAGLELNAAGTMLYVAHGGQGASTSVTTIDLATFTEGAALVTTANAATSTPNIALNPCDGLLYVPHVNYDTDDDEGLTVFDAAGSPPTATVVTTTGGTGYARGIAFVWGTSLVVVGDRDDGEVLAIDRTNLGAGAATITTSIAAIIGVATIPPGRY